MDSFTITLKVSILLLSVLILFGSSRCDNTKEKEECTESLVGLATCLPYVSGSAKAPTPDCCSGLKQVLKTKKKCLCVVIKDRNDPDLQLNINVTLAIGLPNACNAPANISQCPALLNLPPNSPDAQIFYQIGQNSTSGGSASSPSAGGPTANGEPNTKTAPARANTIGTTSQQSNGGFGKGKRGQGLEIIMGGLVILLPFIMY